MSTTKKNMSRTEILRQVMDIKKFTDLTAKLLWDEHKKDAPSKVRIGAYASDVRHISRKLQDIVERV